MKKFSVLGIICALALTITACGGGSQPAETGAQPAKKIIVGTNAAFAPFEFMDKGQIVGFDIDLLAEVMKEAGLEHEVKNMGWDPMLAAVQGKEVDMAIAAVTINEKRKETYDFSSPYFESTHMILVPEGSTIANANDLLDKKIGVQNGTTGQAAVEGLIGAENPNIKKFEDNVVAIMELLNGGVEAVVTDNTVVNEYLKNNPNQKVKGIEDTQVFESEFYGMLFPKDSELRAQMDAGLQKVIESGKYTEIYKKWFGVEPNVEALKQ
ncbi:basic amino acid ABC transporter substrate-binding protein [Ammoniphilus sp. YIM 78166]|uniref:basic amino acid ABC transporter substrate-binding protein n=1 Tax=Ammoniphilus sp. YIM 78166 TaxID=1644106 RepID=UPI00106F6CE0|nr:basic amino acid ABC transporter substrate-binding protein [Ammoniphilus sp. YIM 78166]